MDVQGLRDIVKDAKNSRSMLHVPYAALKTQILEKTGRKTNSYVLRVSDEDCEIAKTMSKTLGISAASLYRLLVKQAFEDWGRELVAAEDEADKAREAMEAQDGERFEAALLDLCKSDADGGAARILRMLREC